MEDSPPVFLGADEMLFQVEESSSTKNLSTSPQPPSALERREKSSSGSLSRQSSQEVLISQHSVNTSVTLTGKNVAIDEEDLDFYELSEQETRQHPKLPGWDRAVQGGQIHYPMRILVFSIRPDVAWQVLKSALYDDLRSAHFGDVRVPATDERLIVVEVIGPTKGWRIAELRIGVTPAKLRVLVVRMFRGEGPPLVALGGGSNAAPTSPRGESLIAQVRVALARSQASLPFLTPTTPASLSPCYVAELISAAAVDAFQSLNSAVLPLEKWVASEELSSAELAVALSPAYVAAGVSLPVPRRGKSLAEYPLDLPRGRCCLEEVGPETVQQLLRKVTANVLSNKGPKLEGKSGVQTLAQAVWAELEDWRRVETAARLHRKDLQVRDRLESVETFRRELVGRLRDSGVRHKDVERLFGPMAHETVLFEHPAVWGTRVGRVWITAKHILFHSKFLTFSWEKVVPIAALVSVGDERSVGEATSVLVLTVVGQERHRILLPAVEDGAVKRSIYILKQLLKEHAESNKPHTEETPTIIEPVQPLPSGSTDSSSNVGVTATQDTRQLPGAQHEVSTKDVEVEGTAERDINTGPASVYIQSANNENITSAGTRSVDDVRVEHELSSEQRNGNSMRGESDAGSGNNENITNARMNTRSADSIRSENTGPLRKGSSPMILGIQAFLDRQRSAEGAPVQKQTKMKPSLQFDD